MAYPTLNKNEVIVALSNMVIGQRTFSNNVGGLDGSLVDKARMEGSMFGDTYIYNSVDVLETFAFDPVDATANGTAPDQANVLIQHIPTKIDQQAITLDVFRQIPITLERTLTKRAFQDEGVWSDFINVLSSLLDETKKVYDVTTYNAFVGTRETATGSQTVSITVPTVADTTDNADQVASNKLTAELIAEKVANIFTDLKDVSKSYNDLGYYRAYKPEDMIVVWNSKYVNYLKNVSLPEIFNSSELKGVFDFSNVLPAKYFGQLSSATTSVAGARALVEMTSGTKHYFAGEVVDTGSTVVASSTYVPDDTIVCKIMHKDSIPYMSGFQTRTEFFNPKSLNENHYLTFAHNTLQHIENYPLITLRAEEAEVVVPEEPDTPSETPEV